MSIYRRKLTPLYPTRIRGEEEVPHLSDED